MGDPFYEHCMLMATGGGINPGSSDEIGELYRSVLHQRGYGLNTEMMDHDHVYGLGFGELMGRLFRAAAPHLKSGLKYLGKSAVVTAANVAEDAINGADIKESAMKHVGDAVSDAAGEVFARAPKFLGEVSGFKSGKAKKRPAVTKETPGRLVARARSKSKRKRARVTYNPSDYPGLARLS